MLSAHRLITLTGAGGSGKTRLALRVAEQVQPAFSEGAAFVDLAALSNPELVPQAVGSVLDISEQGRRPLTETLAEQLRGWEMLLILDNCEHLLEACDKLSVSLLQSCSELKILATSREPLRVEGEVVWNVPPLSIPAPQPDRNPHSASSAQQTYQASEAIQLFADRAGAADRRFALTADNFAWVAEICRRLDGMPLAIELAAARLPALSVRQIAENLDDRFRLLTEGGRTAPPRQQTLQAALEWSYALLSAAESTLLQRLSVFAGGCSLEAAQFVTGFGQVDEAEVRDTLSRLVDKSLVVAARPDEQTVRYTLLETIREYARLQLAEADYRTCRDRHLQYFCEWAERTEPLLLGEEMVQGMQLFRREHDNLRAALDWSEQSDGRIELGLRLSIAIMEFWRVEGIHTEGRRRLHSLLNHEGAQQPRLLRANALHCAAVHAFHQSDYPNCKSLSDEALALFEDLGPDGRNGVADSLEMLAEIASETGDYPQARELYERALPIYEEVGDLIGQGDTLKMLGWHAMREGRIEDASDWLERGLDACRKSGDLRQIAAALSGLGELAIRTGKLQEGQDQLTESLSISRTTGDKWSIAINLGSLGWAAMLRRNYTEMVRLLRESLSLRQETGDVGGIAWCLEKLGQAAALLSRPEAAAEVFGAAAALRTPVGSKRDQADEPAYEQIKSDLREKLGSAAFEAAWNRGAALDIREAIERALNSVQQPGREAAHAEIPGGLTPRELETVKLIALGKSNREIAKDMTVSLKTVETYVTRILGKLGLESRVQVARWALRQNLPGTEEQ